MSILFIKVKQGMVLISHTYVYLHHIHKPTNKVGTLMCGRSLIGQINQC